MTDIVDWLRCAANEHNMYRCDEAADEIERLQAALHTIGYGPPNEGEPLDLLNQFVDLARTALKRRE